ncbi:hypothetical protein AKJ51_03465 [candidate division MSBL1 archaeon SCGC-AAA382A20]|uniref:Toprim domain-containing protein n=1 Tax=candidate division MSBL1 archaeon SCGC-AAA382A20 TaxID=1698280 RepID=A0A133VJG7_9EURY|nr:hypothetical protein AKJ51_03465 [candidate division MSBL1 archaeon SCGC-AAA382A20]
MNQENKDFAEIDIAKVARRLGLNPQRKNGKGYTYCPLCESKKLKNPPQGEKPHHYVLGGENKHLSCCYKCGAGHNPLSLVKVVLSCNAREAFKWLEENGFLPDESKGANPQEDLNPLKKLAKIRGWTTEAMEILGVYSKGSRVVIPMQDAAGNQTGYTERMGDNSKVPVQSGEKTKSKSVGHHGLFYPKGGISADKDVLVCEGEADVIAAISAGYKNVIGTKGAAPGRDSENYLQEIIPSGAKVVLAPDPDDAGRTWRDKFGRLLANAGCEIKFIPPKDRDLDDRLKFEDASIHELIFKAKEWTDPTEDFFDGKTFIPRRLARHIENNHKLAFGFDPEKGAGRIVEYCSGVWRPAVGLDKDAQEALGERTRPRRVTSAMETLKRDIEWIPWRKWNSNRNLINCKSGMVDPITLEVKPHSPDYFSTFQIPHEFNPDAESEVVEKFLQDVLPPDCIETAGMMLGYLLVPKLSADKFFVLEGPAGTGKTTFLNATLDSNIGLWDWWINARFCYLLYRWKSSTLQPTHTALPTWRY